MGWSIHKVPDLSGRRFLVTGANSGIGLEATQMLAARGAHVIMACRTPSKGDKAMATVRAETPEANVELTQLDLASLDSVRACAARVSEAHGSIDVLVNNAGVMALPESKTADGFEIQLGTNHFGHFALTGLLLPTLLAGDAPRVVTVCSIAHWWGRMKFDDLGADKGYSPWGRYGQSKLANLLFVHELTKRLEAKGVPLLSVACHPGYASTNINVAAAAMKGASFTERLMAGANRYLAQSARAGALPTLYAATGDDIEPGGYYGPDGVLQLIGAPAKVSALARARDDAAAARLWDASVEATGVGFAELAP